MDLLLTLSPAFALLLVWVVRIVYAVVNAVRERRRYDRLCEETLSAGMAEVIPITRRSDSGLLVVGGRLAKKRDHL